MADPQTLWKDVKTLSFHLVLFAVCIGLTVHFFPQSNPVLYFSPLLGALLNAMMAYSTGERIYATLHGAGPEAQTELV